MELQHLIESINQTNLYFQNEAVKQVNIALTLRNWVIGFYLFEYEQKGLDRAVYGNKLHKTLTLRLNHIKGLSKSQLYRYKDFYLKYPQIFPTLLGKFKNAHKETIVQTVSAQLLEVKPLAMPPNDPETEVS